ncbi:MAG TPA: DNA-processing protein DprA [Anaerolineae bacterium]
MVDTRYWIAFNRVPGIGAAKLRALIDQCGSPEAAWRADESEWKAAGLDRRAIGNLLAARDRLDLDAELKRVSACGARVLTWEDADYPPLLRSIPDAPPLLYIKGQLTQADAQWAVAMVGTRRATVYGRQAAIALAGDLARNGVTIVSGLARGIDAAAHTAALKAGGRTIGVMACGIDQVYPAEHARLAAQIFEHGALLTEAPIGAPPEAGNFPARNRIISGLALAAIIVEAGEQSGALITADRALEQGREVFAVPGSIFSRASAGTNRLIAEGATLVRSAEDVLEALNLTMIVQQAEAQTAISADPIEASMLNALSHEPMHIDDLMRTLDMPIAQVSSALAMMELKGLVRQAGGMTYVLAREGRAEYVVD